MFEVADATHNTLNKKMLSEMIEFCESAVNTMQNDAFEKREEQRKNEIEINAVVEYCTRNNLKLDDIMALNKHIEKMKQESQLKDQSLSEMTQKMDDDEKNNKKTIQKYEGILANVITQAKKSPFGSDYKISQELISEIRQIIPVESITKSQK